MPTSISPLAQLEPRLRTLLPADLYAVAWVDPSPHTLLRVFEHLRTVQRILRNYMPRQVSESLPCPGQVRHDWQEGTLMFTDLAGFTRLLEANAARGRAGAETLLGVLNTYFAEMLEIISKSGGDLLEFTGDALLAQFLPDSRQSDTARAVRAGLRMQRAMERFASIETPQGVYSLGMRVGIHTGRFLTADIGTPRRMEHVLLGASVQCAKQAEGAGQVGRVCLTQAACERVRDQFHFEPGKPGYVFVVDDLAVQQLGEYDLVPPTRRPASTILLDRSVEGLLVEIEKMVGLVEPMASYLPMPILNLVIESAAHRRITPDFPTPTVAFVNLIGLAESADRALPVSGAQVDEHALIVASFSRVIALINAAVEARGGVLKKVTYHLAGSDMMLCFGLPNAHTDDSMRAADAVLALRDVVKTVPPLTVGGEPVTIACKIGLARGPVFSAEIGEPRGRREFNVLGDTVNIAARLMTRAAENQILVTQAVHQDIAPHFDCEPLGAVELKGKAAPTRVFALHSRRKATET